MLKVQTNVQLASLNTLRLECIAELYAHVSTSEELQGALSEARRCSGRINLLGGGSNLILNRYLRGMTMHIGLLGREIVEESAADVVVRLQAGEDWHETVLWANAKRYFGLENLALIPGSVGAAPVQNIGAYGVEVAQFIERVHVVDVRTGDIRALTAAECCFNYRTSLFKNTEGKHLIITAIDLRLSKFPVVNTSYPALREAVPSDHATPADVLEAVVAIRQLKLPDPRIEANVGSFFKNPIVDRVTAERLQRKYPGMPQYPVDTNTVKLSGAWMIDQLGWRGVEKFGVSVSDNHALVIINKSARYASEVIEFADNIVGSVEEEFGVRLDREPELMGSDSLV